MRGHSYSFLVLSFLLLFVACTKEGNIHGVVKDQKGNLIENAKVEIVPYSFDSTFTNSSGEFDIKELPPNLYTITISKKEFDTTIQKVSVFKGQTTNLQFILTKRAPEISMGTISEITYSSAKLTGRLEELGSETIIDYGHCWNTEPDPTIENNKTSKGIATFTGEFSSNVIDLQANTTYYVRAYATTSTGTYYSEELNFTTSAGATTISILDPANIDYQEITANGYISDLGAETPSQYGFIWAETNSELTTTNNEGLIELTDASDTGKFSVEISGLKAATRYYIRAYAVNSYGTAYSDIIEFSTKSTFTDIRDGRTYDVVQIGEQIWLKENLAYLTAEILGTGAWVYDYVGNSVSDAKQTTNYNTYGVLYDWQTAMEVCPEGWHIPTDEEWITLTNFLGGETVAGGKLKEAGTAHWQEPNTGATNETDFTALPAGIYFVLSDDFNYLLQGAYFWTSSYYDADKVWVRNLGFNNSKILRAYDNKIYARSVRCIKD